MKKYLHVFLWFLLGMLVNTATAEELSGSEGNNVINLTQAATSQDLDLIAQGKLIFRFDTYGSEAFWGDTLGLHAAIAGEKNGGIGPGLSPRAALGLGLKVDVEMIPDSLALKIKNGQVNLDDPATTIALLKLDAVVGIKGFFDTNGMLKSVGIQCSLCHSDVNNSFTKGIGQRLDGWPNRDLNVGKIVSLAPRVDWYADRLGVDMETLIKALNAWGPGKYDAELNMDGKAFRPDGKTAATLIPAAYGLRGVNLHTYTGFGSIPYWNAYVAVTQMRGQGTFYDLRLSNSAQYPIAAKTGDWNIRPKRDLVTSKLGLLHIYQLSLSAPKPADNAFDKPAAERGLQIFNGAGKCNFCHVPPIFTEPGWNMHAGQVIGIDNFQSDRSPDKRYRTSPLAGISFRGKGGYYHDGRFPDLRAVVDHYNSVLQLNLSVQDENDLVEYLKSL